MTISGTGITATDSARLTRSGFVYLEVLLDLSSRAVVGRALGPPQEAAQAPFPTHSPTPCMTRSPTESL